MYGQTAAGVAKEKKADKEKVKEVKRNVLLTLQFADVAKPTLVPDKDVVRVRGPLFFCTHAVDAEHDCSLSAPPQDSLRALKGLYSHQATEFKATARELQEKVRPRLAQRVWIHPFEMLLCACVCALCACVRVTVCVCVTVSL